MPHTQGPAKPVIVFRKTLQKGVVATGLTYVVTCYAIKLVAALTAAGSIALIVLGAFIHSAVTLGIGAAFFFTILVVLRTQALRGFKSMCSLLWITFVVAFYVALTGYSLASLGVLIGGIWINRFSLAATGGLALLPAALYIAYLGRKPDGARVWRLPPEGHLGSNRLKSHEEAKADAQKLR
jgi:hypothetical protein